jgi:hypothetical protein
MMQVGDVVTMALLSAGEDLRPVLGADQRELGGARGDRGGGRGEGGGGHAR